MLAAADNANGLWIDLYGPTPQAQNGSDAAAQQPPRKGCVRISSARASIGALSRRLSHLGPDGAEIMGAAGLMNPNGFDLPFASAQDAKRHLLRRHLYKLQRLPKSLAYGSLHHAKWLGDGMVSGIKHAPRHIKNAPKHMEHHIRNAPNHLKNELPRQVKEGFRTVVAGVGKHLPRRVKSVGLPRQQAGRGGAVPPLSSSSAAVATPNPPPHARKKNRQQADLRSRALSEVGESSKKATFRSGVQSKSPPLSPARTTASPLVSDASLLSPPQLTLPDPEGVLEQEGGEDDDEYDEDYEDDAAPSAAVAAASGGRVRSSPRGDPAVTRAAAALRASSLAKKRNHASKTLRRNSGLSSSSSSSSPTKAVVRTLPPLAGTSSKKSSTRWSTAMTRAAWALAALVLAASLWEPTDITLNGHIDALTALGGGAFWAPALFRAVLLLAVVYDIFLGAPLAAMLATASKYAPLFTNASSSSLSSPLPANAPPSPSSGRGSNLFGGGSGNGKGLAPRSVASGLGLASESSLAAGDDGGFVAMLSRSGRAIVSAVAGKGVPLWTALRSEQPGVALGTALSLLLVAHVAFAALKKLLKWASIGDKPHRSSSSNRNGTPRGRGSGRSTDNGDGVGVGGSGRDDSSHRASTLMVWELTLHEWDPRRADELNSSGAGDDEHHSPDGLGSHSSSGGGNNGSGRRAGIAGGLEGDDVDGGTMVDRSSLSSSRRVRPPMGHSFTLAAEATNLDWSHVWRSVPASAFSVRGGNYLADKVKEPSAGPLFEIIGGDSVISDGPIRHFASRIALPDTSHIVPNGSTVPALLVMNIQVPVQPRAMFGARKLPPTVNAVFYMRLTPETAAAVAKLEAALASSSPSSSEGAGSAADSTTSSSDSNSHEASPASPTSGSPESEATTAANTAAAGEEGASTQQQAMGEGPVRLLHRWCRDAQTDDVLRGALKLLGEVLNLAEVGAPSFVQSYNKKPVLLAGGGLTGSRLGFSQVCV